MERFAAHAATGVLHTVQLFVFNVMLWCAINALFESCKVDWCKQIHVVQGACCDRQAAAAAQTWVAVGPAALSYFPRELVNCYAQLLSIPPQQQRAPARPRASSQATGCRAAPMEDDVVATAALEGPERAAAEDEAAAAAAAAAPPAGQPQAGETVAAGAQQEALDPTMVATHSYLGGEAHAAWGRRPPHSCCPGQPLPPSLPGLPVCCPSQLLVMLAFTPNRGG